MNIIVLICYIHKIYYYIKKYFFNNIGSIILFAIIGTLIATIITGTFIYYIGKIGLATAFTGKEAFAFGALISATDPVAVLSIFSEMSVDKTLFALIFGESILNDAVSLILFEYEISFYILYFNSTLVTLYQENLKADSNEILHGTENFLKIFLGSLFIGIFTGLFCAYVIFYFI